MLCLLGADWGAAEKVFLFVKEFAESHSGRRHERCFEDECVFAAFCWYYNQGCFTACTAITSKTAML